MMGRYSKSLGYTVHSLRPAILCGVGKNTYLIFDNTVALVMSDAKIRGTLYETVGFQG